VASRSSPGGAEWTPDARLIDYLNSPAVLADSDGAIREANRAACTLFDLDHTDLLGRHVGTEVFDDVRRQAVGEILARVASGSPWSGGLTVLTSAGATEVETIWTPTWRDGSVTGVLVLVESLAVGTGRDAHLAGRLSRLAASTADLLVATSIDEVTRLVTDHVTDAAGATIGSMSLLVDDDTLALMGIRGGRAGVASRWATYPLSGNTPGAETVRTNRPLVLIGNEAVQNRYPGLESAAVGERSLVCLPLSVAGTAIGVVSLSFPGLRAIDASELEFLRLLTDTCAQAITRIRAQAEADDRESKLRFLAEASERLASDLDYERTLVAVADLAVPGFADWCAIALEEDGSLRTLSVAHCHPEHVDLVAELQQRYPSSPDAEHGAYAVLRTGRPELIPEVSDDLLAASARDEEHLRLLRALGFRSGLVVPLKGRNGVAGVITWVTGESGRRYSSADLAFAEDLALRAVNAIENAQLHSQLREAALRLQRAVLPDRLPDLPGWDLAVRYLPSGRTGAGGDFYDLVPLCDGRLVFFVGDVMGRGVEATSVMAQMRSAVLTLVAVDPEPDVVMAGLDRVFERWQVEQLVTVVYGVIDASRDEVRVVNAGHPPPAVLRADGRVELVETPDTLILGAGGGRRSVVATPLRPGDTLLAFTDGLVERRGEDADESTDRLLRRCTDPTARADLDSWLDALVTELRDPTRDDDVAALALRRT
jgi:PAS domain S-box-containing protein